MNIKPCPLGKNRNSVTKRCRKSCARGKVRDSITKRCDKKCPEGKVRNSLTKRCIKPCPEGKNYEFISKQCIKQIIPVITKTLYVGFTLANGNGDRRMPTRKEIKKLSKKLLVPFMKDQMNTVNGKLQYNIDDKYRVSDEDQTRIIKIKYETKDREFNIEKKLEEVGDYYFVDDTWFWIPITYEVIN